MKFELSTMKLILVMAIFSIFFSSCQVSKIDSSSRETYNESIAEMLKPLPYEEQIRLLENMQIIAFEGEDMNDFVKNADKEDIHYQLHMSKLDGMTLEEINNLGEDISSRYLNEGKAHEYNPNKK